MDEMMVVDVVTGKKVSYINPKFIPREGERVWCGAEPIRTVKSITYDYDNSTVLVMVEDDGVKS